jgi:L-asparaginase
VPVTLLAAGGTIAMAGSGPVVPALDATGLVAAVPGLAVSEARTIGTAPGAQVTAAGALEIARLARDEAARGRGVVVTHGTDTLEETAYLTDLLHGGDAPIVFTGAIRPASAPGADGPANLLDAVAAAGTPDAAGLGVLVAFAGELHAARDVRKADSVSPRAFASPRLGPVGFVREGRVEIVRRLDRPAPLDPAHLDATVRIVPTWLGDDGALLRAAARGADGLVAVALGAGHVPPGYLEALREVAARIPVMACVRPERGAMLRATYGFEGAEGDLRASGVVPAAELAPQHARMRLLACLGAGVDPAGG